MRQRKARRAQSIPVARPPPPLGPNRKHARLTGSQTPRAKGRGGLVIVERQTADSAVHRRRRRYDR